MNYRQHRSVFRRPRGAHLLLTAWVVLVAGFLAQAVAAASAEPDSPQVLARQAAGDFASGRFEEAVNRWDTAAAAYAESGDSKGQIDALLGKGNAYLALGRHADAIDTLEDARALAKEAADPELMAVASASLGNGYLLTGRADEAGTLLGAAIAEARAIGRWDIAARAGNDQGNRLASMDRLAVAIEAYREALQDAERADDRLTVAKTRVNLARALWNSERPDEAREELFQAVTELITLPHSHEQSFALISAGRLFAIGVKGEAASTGDQLLANQAFEAGVASAEVIDDRRALSYALGYQSELYEGSGRTGDALLLARQATFAAQRANAPEILYRWQWAVGRLLAEQGEIVQALASYERAVYTLNAIRPDLVGGYRAGQASFREEVGPLFLELADLELQQAVAKTDPAEREASLRRVRETVEALKGVELADYFQDDCVAVLKSKTVGIDQLADRTAAIYPIIFDDRIELLVSLPSGTKLYTTRVPSQDVEKVVRGFRGTLERRITHQYRRPSRQVYDWLIRPMAADLAAEDIDTLVIVPDGVLRLIPMAALHDGERYLIEQYAVATSPGLTLTDPTPIERKNIRVLMSGLTESVQGFPALPNVAAELANISAMYPGTVLQNETFLAENVESELQETSYSIVHLATHGEFSRKGGESYVLTYDGRLDMDDLQQYMSMTTFREQPIELLTLSACQTAAGDDRAALGLAGIAVKAGARSALATLWFINDQASAVLVSEFYSQLQDPSLSKAKALQQAQLKLLEDPRYSHPIYWSPFLLIGNWL
jgi:CHAT domain-containing protein